MFEASGLPQEYKNINKDELRNIYDTVKQMLPDVWRVAYPRIYEEPKCGHYYSPKEPAHQILAITLKTMGGMDGMSDQTEFLAVSQLARFGVPQYWLSEGIATAIRQTMPPMEIEWYDMHLPFEAMCFMMPKGSLVHPQEGDVSFIAFARFKAGESHMSPLIKGTPFGSFNGCMTFLCMTEGGGHILHWNLPLEGYGPKIRVPDLEALVDRYKHHTHTTALSLYQPTMTDDDNLLMAHVAHYVFGTLLLMTSRPEMVTPSRMLKRVVSKGVRKEFWAPNVIGQNYKIRREPAHLGGTHASPIFHWVRGSWKEQPYGPKNSLRKHIWIEPYTRG